MATRIAERKPDMASKNYSHTDIGSLRRSGIEWDYTRHEISGRIVSSQKSLEHGAGDYKPYKPGEPEMAFFLNDKSMHRNDAENSIMVVLSSKLFDNFEEFTKMIEYGRKATVRGYIRVSRNAYPTLIAEEIEISE
jgi:hypothetical protein